MYSVYRGIHNWYRTTNVITLLKRIVAFLHHLISLQEGNIKADGYITSNGYYGFVEIVSAPSDFISDRSEADLLLLFYLAIFLQMFV